MTSLEIVKYSLVMPAKRLPHGVICPFVIVRGCFAYGTAVVIAGGDVLSFVVPRGLSLSADAFLRLVTAHALRVQVCRRLHTANRLSYVQPQMQLEETPW